MILRVLGAIALTTALTGVGSPASADRSSPEDAVNKLWDLVDTYQGARAYNAVAPYCRDASDRRGLQRASKEISDLTADAGAFLYVGDYKEKVDGRTARVTYTLKIYVSEYDKAPVETFRKQRWVRIGNRWHLACNQRLA